MSIHGYGSSEKLTNLEQEALNYLLREGDITLGELRAISPNDYKVHRFAHKLLSQNKERDEAIYTSCANLIQKAYSIGKLNEEEVSKLNERILPLVLSEEDIAARQGQKTWEQAKQSMSPLTRKAYEQLNITDMNQTAFDILGLEKGATAAEVKKAHQKLVLTYHPDKPTPPGLTKELQAEVFKIVSAAYEWAKAGKGDKKIRDNLFKM
ncbi:MAG: DnaJ domain-containing protein [Chlamydiales bacterium]|nr:DnaJ domain-containing protein [Chlamydiales bacterium]